MIEVALKKHKFSRSFTSLEEEEEEKKKIIGSKD